MNGLTHCALHAPNLSSFVVLARRKSPLSKNDTTPLKRKIWTRISNSFVRCSNAPLTSGVPYTVKTVWTSCKLPNLIYVVQQITAILALRVTPSAGSPSANNASCPFALSLRSRLIQKLRTGSRSCVSPLVPKHHLFAQKDAKNKTRLHLTLTFARARP